ncbi:hypothetical protein [Sphingomonas sp.]|jgi:hypothetical protein|uniref:hypothetical protein n=1 Tax=Sphingomonas sp. TaxID=28214 RepID=UPI002E315AD0|nr:hypothetical protein [Sphingomonas sp.]HEX4695867.1 hypothetical protein [Sphingomonas sp.]
MKTTVRDSIQTTQRVKVGLIGLATVVLLIGLAATIFAIVSREKPGTAAGAPKADVAANLTLSNTPVPSDAATSEPLAELGVAPAATPTAAPAHR